MYDKSKIINHCKPGGGCCSTCLEKKDISRQQVCSFFKKNTYAETCTNLRFEEYCGCRFAQDNASGKEVADENIPNYNPNATSSLFDLPGSEVESIIARRRQLRKNLDEHEDAHRRYRRPVKQYQMSEQLANVKKIIDQQVKSGKMTVEFADYIMRCEKGECEFTEDYSVFEGLEGVHPAVLTGDKDMTHEKFWMENPSVVWPNHCKMVTVEDLEEYDHEWKEHSDEDLVVAAKEYFKVTNPLAGGFPVSTAEDFEGLKGYLIDKQSNFSIPVDNSGSLSHMDVMEFQKLLAKIEEDTSSLYPKMLASEVTPEYLKDIVESCCGAYSEQFDLYLDMTDPNLYTIYTSSGGFLPLSNLIRDGVNPLDLKFKLRDGDTCFEEYGFEEFVEHIEKMLSSGR